MRKRMWVNRRSLESIVAPDEFIRRSRKEVSRVYRGTLAAGSWADQNVKSYSISPLLSTLIMIRYLRALLTSNKYRVVIELLR